MFKLLSGILSKNGDRKDRSLVRGRSARHPWSLMRLLGRYDAATITVDNVRHWAAADGLSASAANSPEVRRTLRNRSRYEIGPVNEIAGRIWNLHEFGGVATKRRKLKPHRFKVGEARSDSRHTTRKQDQVCED